MLMVIKAIKELQKTHKEMSNVLKDLEKLEDGVDANYTDVVLDYKWLVQDLKHRRTTLQKRGRCL